MDEPADPKASPVTSGLVEAWDRVRPVHGGALHAHCEIEVDLTGPIPIFEVRLAYNGSRVTATRHVSLDAALAQSARLKRVLDERGWQAPAAKAEREVC